MKDPRDLASMFSIDVSANPGSAANTRVSSEELVLSMLRQFLVGQERQTKLMEEMVQHLSSAQKQRHAELGQWRQQNPELADSCRMAAETLVKVQTEYLKSITQEVADSDESLSDSEYMLNEFVDRFGPRLAHLNGVLQVLSQLAAPMQQSK